MITNQAKNIYAAWFLILLWSAIHIALFLFYGIRDLFDARTYLGEADYILANGTLKDFSYTFYVTYIGVITLFRWLFPGEVYPIIIFQCLISGITLLLLSKASVKIASDWLAGLFTCVIFLCWWDNIQWNTILMTESLACSLMCFLVYVLSRFQGNTQDFLWILVLLILGFFTRPTGVIPIAGVVFFLLAYYWDSIRTVKGLKLFLIAGVFISGLFAADAMFFNWDLSENYVHGNIVTYMNRIEDTVLYEPSLQLDPTELKLPPAETRPLLKMIIFIRDNPVHFLKASTLRVWYLVSGIRPYYTTLHNVYTAIWMLTVYILFLFGWKQIKNNPMRIFVLSAIVVNCLIVAVFTVDWNNRFYITMEPVIVLVAGMGAAYVFEECKRLLSHKLPTK